MVVKAVTETRGSSRSQEEKHSAKKDSLLA